MKNDNNVHHQITFKYLSDPWSYNSLIPLILRLLNFNKQILSHDYHLIMLGCSFQKNFEMLYSITLKYFYIHIKESADSNFLVVVNMSNTKQAKISMIDYPFYQQN